MMNIDDDTIGSMAFKHNQFEYHGIDDNYSLTSDMLDIKQFSEVMESLNAYYKICFNNNKVSHSEPALLFVLSFMTSTGATFLCLRSTKFK